MFSSQDHDSTVRRRPDQYALFGVVGESCCVCVFLGLWSCRLYYQQLLLLFPFQQLSTNSRIQDEMVCNWATTVAELCCDWQGSYQKHMSCGVGNNFKYITEHLFFSFIYLWLCMPMRVSAFDFSVSADSFQTCSVCSHTLPAPSSLRIDIFDQMVRVHDWICQTHGHWITILMCFYSYLCWVHTAAVSLFL